MRTFVLGDIHGAAKALEQCLDRSGFDNDNDLLIQLGDVVDWHDEVFECVEILLQVKHLIAIKGNHDDWFDDFLRVGAHPRDWIYGGGSDRPLNAFNIWNIDTGAARSGRLTMRNVDTKEYWLSDPLPMLCPGE